MQLFTAHLASYASCVGMSLDDPEWHTKAKVPAVPGWYFITTNTPLKVLQAQELWATHYAKKRSGLTAPVRNYDLASRARRYADDLASFWNTSEVYSGMASNLKARAREHTFADPGTGGFPAAHERSFFEEIDQKVGEGTFSLLSETWLAMGNRV